MSYRYDPSRTSLFHPAKDANFFPAGRPAAEPALCAEMSRLAYVPFERDGDGRQRVRDVLERVGFSPPYLFSGGGTQGFLTSDVGRTVSLLAFRGTEVNWADRVTALAAWPIGWSEGGKVHGGFARALAAVWTDLAPRLAEAPGRRVYTGHSLGAALATLAASRHPPDILYTYGSPRVGDDAFVRTLARRESQRYTNCCDLVCRLPFELFGYRHLGPRRYVDREGAVRVDPDRAAVTRDRVRARVEYLKRWAWRPGALCTRDLADHSPVNYVSALTGLR